MQIQMMDQMMDAWEEQIKSPSPMTVPSAMLSKLKSLPSISPAGSWPNVDTLPMAAMNPVPVLDAIRRTMAESLGRRDGVWH
jgi:hypothetical protein